MKLFTIDERGKFVQFKEQEFKVENKEVHLEILLEKNPEYFFDNSKILIIGRQVTTNLNTFIDLLGIDQFGNTVVIELKREKTPRETLAQLIEYASFIDNLDYEQLNEIYQNYFTGKKEGGGRGSLFSDSSDSEKVEFKQKLTFVHPGKDKQTLFCSWHGKVQTPQLRIHFSSRILATEPLYIVYVGPKITKQ